MTNQTFPITPPPELVWQWWEAAMPDTETSVKDQLCTQAAQWGADQELKARCEWLDRRLFGRDEIAELRAARAADLLQHQHPQPVAVSERLPEPSVKVLAHYFNALGKGRTICAIWVPAKSRSDKGDLDADDFLEYDEESDKYHWPEGWYEAIENWEELGWAKVYEGEIAYWQPLPQWPANALPTPEATNARPSSRNTRRMESDPPRTGAA